MTTNAGVGETLRGLPWRRLAAFFFAAVATITISFFVGWSARGYKHLPTLLTARDGLERDFDSGINAQVREMFPAGSREDDLIRYLDAEGFVPEWHTRNDHNAGRFVHDGIFCRKIARVLWRANERGRLTNVSGGYASRCVTDPPVP